MIRPAIIASFLILLGIGLLLVPAGAPANAAGVHQFGNRPSHQHQATPRRHHRHFNRYVPWVPGYYGSYDYGVADTASPPPPPAPREKPVAETRRECEPKTYTVPAADGGESQVTVIRC